MKGYMMGMLAETHIHPGAGQVYGVIDLPVAREQTTDYPMIPGSGLKGALRDKYKEEGVKDVEYLFGKEDQAGVFGVTDARLLLLPVRSFTGHYRWVTCPYLIKRLYRDLHLIGYADRNRLSLPLEFPGLSEEKMITATQAKDGPIFLEEFTFEVVPDRERIEQLAAFTGLLIHHDCLKEELPERLSIITDEEFAHFARYALPVNFRNELENDTKKSKSLWQEEVIPPDTLFYTLFIARLGKDEDLKRVLAYLNKNVYLQVGGNETVGQGWMVTRVVGVDSDE
ncbi:type III-B CRISPR module RAMP protein Cmr4 [Thermoactinomyces mirandus]|uniref:Type III-B CRISPR module RAMP protein Cmr4 n=1 Tax=Thermoactinomyces mirandus TaxID=2756294 RepID=A0A7W2AS43_9BACL|nr:type III-B CRISPR module RAMP protein Cmr4 [Thermoactinomyces mirandus]MBA4603664.1 type III-B CRISPR module RAMP protein Cmr4 [Thermoactinomyces mirandus]